AAVVQVLLELGLVELAPAHAAEHPDDLPQDDEVDDADENEEDARDRRPDEAGGLLQPGLVVLHLTRARPDAEGEQQAEPEHNRGGVRAGAAIPTSCPEHGLIQDRSPSDPGARLGAPPTLVQHMRNKPPSWTVTCAPALPRDRCGDPSGRSCRRSALSRGPSRG